MKKLVLYFKGDTPDIQELEIDDNLQTYYKLIDCDTIDMTVVNGVNVVVDDNGLLNERDITYLQYQNDKLIRALVGPLVFVGRTDENGENTNIILDDIINIDNLTMVTYQNKSNQKKYALLDRE
jgi:hypothetical protein